MAKRGGGSLFVVSFFSILGFTCISERMTHDGTVDGKTVLFGEGGFLQLRGTIPPNWNFRERAYLKGLE